MKKYFDVLITEFKNQLVYIPAFMLKNIFFIIIMWIFFTLWKVVYSRGNMDGIFSLEQMIWYLTFTECIELSKGRVYWDVQDEVKSGSIAYTLSRPYSYNVYQLSRTMGSSLVKLIPLLIMGYIIATIMVGHLPGYFTSILPGLFVLIGGIVLTSLWNLIIGLCSFWVEDAFPFLLVLQKIIFIFGGLFFPIEFLPDWGQGLAKLLPFTYSAYWPAMVMVNFNIDIWLRVLVGQIFWIFFLLGMAQFLFKTAVRRLHVQGG